jgi:hypothetical protein
MSTAFVEYGFDLDNNRFGFGRSVEIEDGSAERRTKDKVRFAGKTRLYFRLWIFKRVLAISPFPATDWQ